MINTICIEGNLVDVVRVQPNSNGGLTAFGKIGVYNGKDKEGNKRESMFFDLIVSGRDAEILRDNAGKGTPVVVCGRLEEDRNTADDGRLFINKRIICTSAKPLVKPIVQEPVQQYQQVPVQQVPVQPMYNQPVQQYQQVAPQQGYAQPVQQPGSPW